MTSLKMNIAIYPIIFDVQSFYLLGGGNGCHIGDLTDAIDGRMPVGRVVWSRRQFRHMHKKGSDFEILQI